MRAMGFLFMILLGISLTANAARVGDFEITAQPVNQESSQITSQSNWYISKEKSQNLVYKVRIDNKSLDPMEKLEVHYVVAFTPARKENVVKDVYSISNLARGGKVEFETKGVQNTYRDTTAGGSRYRDGKVQLIGIAIRILKDKEIVAEWANPSSAKSLLQD